MPSERHGVVIVPTATSSMKKTERQIDGTMRPERWNSTFISELRRGREGS